MGYYYAVCHFVNRSWNNKVKILFLPILAHGVYDFVIESVSINPTESGVMVFLLLAFCVIMHRQAYEKIIVQARKDQNNAIGL